MAKKIVLFAYSEPGYEALKKLMALKANVVAVYTHQDDPEEEIWFPSVYELAKEYKIPVYRPKKITEDIAQEIMYLKPDLCLSVYFRRLIPDHILDSAPLGSYNLHGALLPKYRGQTCINWAVVNGEKITGATLHKMTDKADEGPIVAQLPCTIEDEDTAIDIFHKISRLTGEIMEEALPKLLAGTADLKEQNHAEATYYPRRRPKDGLVHWEKSAWEIYNLIRGVTHPFPGAFTFINERKLLIWQVTILKDLAGYDLATAKIGEVLSSNPLIIKTGDGAVAITAAQWADELYDEKNIAALNIQKGAICSADLGE